MAAAVPDPRYYCRFCLQSESYTCCSGCLQFICEECVYDRHVGLCFDCLVNVSIYKHMYKNHFYDYSVRKAIGNSFTALAEKQSASMFCDHLVGCGLQRAHRGPLSWSGFKAIGNSFTALAEKQCPSTFCNHVSQTVFFYR